MGESYLKIWGYMRVRNKTIIYGCDYQNEMNPIKFVFIIPCIVVHCIISYQRMSVCLYTHC